MNLQSPVSAGSRSLKMYAGRLEKLGIFTIEDFLHHLPSRYEDYSIISKIGQLQAGETVTVKGQVINIKNQYLRGGRIKTIQKATIADETGQIELIWFNQPFIIKSLLPSSTVSVSGKVDQSPRTKSIKSPIYEVVYNDHNDPIHTGRLIPVYPETHGITSKWLRRQIHNIMDEYKNEISEYMPEELIKKNGFLDFGSALNEVHFPTTLDKAEKARERLAFDELFMLQLAANTRRIEWKEQRKTKAFKIKKYKTKIEELINSLPFDLTQSQKNAAEDILQDLGSTKPMNRLLQGDVGSGKTIVAAIGMYISSLNGFQSVLMAPTEILAEQHFSSISKLMPNLNVKLVTRSTKKTKEKIMDFDILIGTHAVLGERVEFSKLGFVVIDEQQRFGVEQRGIIREKGANPHLLTMTATPIPRTVALTMYGDLDLSYLKDMPKNRKVIKTWLVPPEKRKSAYEWIKKQIRVTESLAFIICPFIDESENMQTVKAANNEYELLKDTVFKEFKMGLLHGRLKSKEKEVILDRFRTGEYEILVATPVVEVGIDIPNATIIMIEASERFGLAQLHQLRGRVGRGDKQSYCLLFTDSFTAQNSQRLKGMETLHSGAELAELDLKLRGPGNMYGTSQHGVPQLKAASFSDSALIQKAKQNADEYFPIISRYKILKNKMERFTLQRVSPD